MTDGNYRNQRRDEFLRAQKLVVEDQDRIMRYMQRWNLKRGRELLWSSIARRTNR